MIDPSIQDSEQVRSLSSDASKVYLFMISNADDEGSMTVSAPMLRSMAFPLREDLRPSDVAQAAAADLNAHIAQCRASTSIVHDDHAIQRISERLQTIDSGVEFFRSALKRALNKNGVKDANGVLLTAVLTVGDRIEECRADSARDRQRKAVTPRKDCPRCHARGPAFGSGVDRAVCNGCDGEWAMRDSEWELIDSS